MRGDVGIHFGCNAQQVPSSTRGTLRFSQLPLYFGMYRCEVCNSLLDRVYPDSESLAALGIYWLVCPQGHPDPLAKKKDHENESCQNENFKESSV